MVKIVCIISVLLLGFSFTADATTVTDSDIEKIKHSVRVLKGIDTDMTTEAAISTLRYAAEHDSVPYAMNSLGLTYMAGIGIEKDTVNATAWMELAAAKGFREANHNLGMLYKDAPHGHGQDFFRAFDYFMKGSDCGSVMCMYDAGYMLYKGLGCRQDYAKAAELFMQGADKDHSPCLYMLGLCYRNGYGVEQDEERAAYFLNRAATFGYSAAIEEVRRPHAENWMHEIILECDSCDDIPTRLPDIQPDQYDVSLLSGRYQGFIVMYDWSGRFILGEKPVTLSLSNDNNALSGTLILANDTVAFRASITSSGEICFTDGGLELNERYTVGNKVPYRMDSATLDVWPDKIAGQLSLYSLKLNEPERPMYIELTKSSPYSKLNEENEDNRYSRVVASPNPFVTQFDVTFELQEPGTAKLKLYDIFGKLAYSQDLGYMERGKHTESIVPNVIDGTYVLNVTIGNRVLRTIIVKKGGVR